MSIQKKSLLNTLKTTKKANIARDAFGDPTASSVMKGPVTKGLVNKGPVNKGPVNKGPVNKGLSTR
jgi:hypothetical protein